MDERVMFWGALVLAGGGRSYTSSNKCTTVDAKDWEGAGQCVVYPQDCHEVQWTHTKEISGEGKRNMKMCEVGSKCPKFISNQ